MSDISNPTPAPGSNGSDPDLQPGIRILAQYIKDLSFESPHVPESLRASGPPPQIDLNVELNAQGRDDGLYEIDLKLAAKKAQAGNLDQTPAFARKLAYYRDKLSMEELLGSVAKEATTDEAVHKAYDEAAKAEPPQEEIHARHILVPTEDEAKAALARIKGGEDFAKVATELSKDPSGDGGDLGWFTKDRMVPEFSEAAFKLKKGEVSDPVKTQFGWHIIKVEDVRTKSFPPFEQVKDQAARYVAQKAESETIAQLHGAAKIQLFDADGKPIAAQPAAAPDKGGEDAQGKDASPAAEKPKTP